MTQPQGAYPRRRASAGESRRCARTCSSSNYHPAMDRARRIARQHVQTDRLLGAQEVPLAPPSPPVSPAAKPRAHVEIEVTMGQVPAAPGAGRAAGGPAPSSNLFTKPAEVPDGLTPEQKQEALDALRARHDAECAHCTIAQNHTQTVFGEGNPDADLMFVGEAPGEEEDRTGRPFVGRAGKKLDDMIKAMGLEREDVYIANILKSRPPGNRTPLPSEVDACSPWLADQIRIIRPKVLVALGGPSAKWMLRTNVGITKLRGTWGVFTDGDLSIPIMPTFHPAYLLRNYTVDTRRKVWSDMQSVMQRLGIAE